MRPLAPISNSRQTVRTAKPARASRRSWSPGASCSRGDIRYADVIERTLYNIVAVSPAEDGKAFFYANPLHKRVEGQEIPDDVASLRASDSGRAAWFNVSCCPTNVSRTFAQLGTYIATTSERGVQLLQYVSGTIKAQLADGSPVTLRVTTDYPHDGAIRIEVLDAPTTAWELTVRIPAWAQGATAEVNGESQSVAAPSLILDDVTPAGTVIELNLPLETRWSYPDERIDAIRGCVALEKEIGRAACRTGEADAEVGARKEH